MKNVLIINGHPNRTSFNHALSHAYYKGASETNAQIEQIVIADLVFDPNLAYGYRKNQKGRSYRLGFSNVVVCSSRKDERFYRSGVLARDCF